VQRQAPLQRSRKSQRRQADVPIRRRRKRKKKKRGEVGGGVRHMVSWLVVGQ